MTAMTMTTFSLHAPGLLNLVNSVLCLVIFALALRVERRISPLKTYYPLLKRIFALVGAIYVMASIAAFAGWNGTNDIRLVSNLAFLALLWWSNRFISRRNAKPQWFVVRADGAVEPRPHAELKVIALNAGSAARHGDLTKEELDQLAADVQEGYQQLHWREVGLPDQLAARRREQEEHG